MAKELMLVLLPLFKFAAMHAPEVLSDVKQMFDKGIPTVEEIEAERARVGALTLDDVSPTPSANG